MVNSVMRSKFYLSLTLIAILCGCAKDKPSFSLLSDQNVFTQSGATVNNKIDILWVIDNSGSMGPSQTNLTNNFHSFIQNFQNKGYDFKIAVTTTDAYLAASNFVNDPTRAKFRDGKGATHTGVFVIDPSTPNLENTFVTNASQGTSGSGDERAFSSFREALNSSLNAGFLRSDAFLAIIIVSDEDDFSGSGRCQNCPTDHDYSAATLDTVNSYVSYLDTLTNSVPALRKYNVSAITISDAACQSSYSGGTLIIGQRYIQIAQTTDGVIGSICDTSFATSLNAIQSKIAELSTQFFLNRVPIESTITVQVNGAMIAKSSANGWTYNPAANSIVFHGTAIPGQGATIIVNFDPVTIK